MTEMIELEWKIHEDYCEGCKNYDKRDHLLGYCPKEHKFVMAWMKCFHWEGK